jgi:hypothetical protein
VTRWEDNDFDFDETPEGMDMNASTTKTIDADTDGIQSLGQASAAVVEQSGRAMAARSTQTSVTPMDMIDRALMSNATPETLERLLALQERWEATQARKAFDEAMSAAKSEIPVISKNRVVDFTSSKGRTHYKHEDLAEIARTVNPILGKHGLSYRFRTSSAAGEPVSVTCIVSHRLGYFEENTLTAGRDESGNKNSIQAVGSTLTYLQRMTLKAALGLAAAEDDDGAKIGTTGGADAGPITAEQAAAIRLEIQDTATDEAKFLEWLDVASIEDIHSSQLARVMNSFAAKKRRMAS